MQTKPAVVLIPRIAAMAAMWVGLTVVVIADDTQPEDFAPEVAYVVGGMRQAASALQPASVHVDLRESFPMQWISLWQETVTPDRTLDETGTYAVRTQHGRWYRSGNRVAMVIDSPSLLARDDDGLTTVLSRRLVSDGRTTRSLMVYRHDSVEGVPHHYATGTMGPPQQTLADGWWAPQEWLDPAYAAYAYGQGPETRSLVAWLTTPAAKAEYLGEEEVFGALCHVVRFSPTPEDQATVWLDEEHGFVKRRLRVTTWREARECLVREEQAPELIESHGHWLPAVWDMATYWTISEAELAEFRARGADLPGVTVEDGLATLLPLRMQLTFTRFEVGVDPPPEALSLDWPLGTQIVSQQTGKILRVVAVDRETADRLPEEH